MIDLNLLEVKPKKNLKIILETLTRIGIAHRRNQVLYPSCYLYEANGRYFLVHFKELYLILREDGYNNLTEQDIARRNAIAFCLENWGLVDVVDQAEIQMRDKHVFVLNRSEKDDWTIEHKINYRFNGEVD